MIIWVNGCVDALLVSDSWALAKKLFPTVQLHKTVPKCHFSPLCDKNEISTGSLPTR